MTAAASTPSGRHVANLNLGFVLLTVLLIAGVVRFLPLGTTAYPLNDGGLFVRMADDLARNGFLLPTWTTYNGESIPFAYPPLGLYLTAAIGRTLGVESVAVVRWLPAVLSTLSVLAFYAMAAELLRSRWRGVVAAAALAVMPHSYEWLIVGGGITRSLGLLLSLLALQQGIRMLRTHRPENVVATAALGGLTLLSHPPAAVFLAASMLTVLAFHVFRGRGTAAGVEVVLAGLGALLVASPWLAVIIANHGVETLVSSGRTAVDPGSGLGQLSGLVFADAPVLDLMTALGVLGIVVGIARGQWMIPVWLVVIVLVDPRAGATYATIPLALSVVPIFRELLQCMIPAEGGPGTLDSVPVPRLVRTHRVASIVLVLLLFITLRTNARTAADPSSPLHGLAADQVAAMGWVNANVAEQASFALVTGRPWDADYLSEWFPTVTGHTSVATVQGSEWRGFAAFLERLAQYRQLQDCSTRTAACLDEWTRGWGLPPTYLFLPKGRLSGPSSPSDCCPALRETLRASDRFLLVYDGPGATIFAPAR